MWESVEARTIARCRGKVVGAVSAGVLAAIAGVLGDHDISIESVRQKAASGETAEIVWVTHEARECNMRAALKEMKELPAVEQVYNWLRVEE